MRLVDLQEQEQLDEDLKDRLRSIWQGITGGTQGPGGASPTPAQSAGQAAGQVAGGVGDIFRRAKGAITGQVDDFRKGAGLSQAKLGALTGKEKEIYQQVDAYVKGMHRIAQTFRNGIQVDIPNWNAANRKYVGNFMVEDPEVEQTEIEAIFQNPDYQIPQGASRKKKQLLEALKRFSKLHKQFVQQGVNDSSRVTPKGIQIQFDLGANAEAFKSAVLKIDKKVQGDDIDERELSQLTPEEIAQAVLDGRLEFSKLSDERKKAVLQTFPHIKKDAPVADQMQALPVAMAAKQGSPASDIANLLIKDGAKIAPGLDLNAFDGPALKQIAQAMGLNTGNLRKTGIIKVIMTALSSGDIQNVNDLNKMSKAQIATLLEKGRLSAPQMAKDQVDKMLDYYKMPPNQDPSKRAEQLQLTVNMKKDVSKLDVPSFIDAMKRGLFSADDLASAGIPNALVQKMLIASGQQIERADRRSLINQLKSLEPQAQAPQKNWKDRQVRDQAAPAEIVQAIADDKLDLADLKREEIQRIFDPNDKAAVSAIDQLDIARLAEVMPEVIDEGYLKINDASAKMLQAYLQGKGFKKRLSGNLDGLRKQARSVQGQVRAEQISKDTVRMAKDLLSDGLKDEGEEFKTMHSDSAVNKAVKNLQSDDEAFQKFVALDEDDQATELAKMGRTIFFQRKKGASGGAQPTEEPKAKEEPKTTDGGDEQPQDNQDAEEEPAKEPEDNQDDEEEEEDDQQKAGSGSTLDADANRTINGIIQQLKKWGQDQGPVKQRLSDMARELMSQGIKTNSAEFAQELFNKYRQKYRK